MPYQRSNGLAFPCYFGRAIPGQVGQIRSYQEVFDRTDAAEQQQHEAAEQQARAQEDARKAAEAQQIVAQEEHQKKLGSKRYLQRKTERFSSYEDAVNALDPMDPGNAMFGLATGPMGLKGRPITFVGTISQNLGMGQFLVTSCEPVGTVCSAMMILSPGFRGQPEFVDGQRIKAVAEVVDTYSYETIFHAQKTVPRLIVYGIAPGY